MKDKDIRLEILLILKKRYDVEPHSFVNKSGLLKELKVAENELDRNIRYLMDKGLIETQYYLGGGFLTRITSLGIDNLEYTEEEQGIATKRKLIEDKKSEEELIEDTEPLIYYLNENLNIISHPFDRDKYLKISESEKKLYMGLFVKLLNIKLEEERLKTLRVRFLDAFNNYINCSRKEKSTLLNSLTNLLDLFEVILKKIVYIRYPGTTNGIIV